MLGCARLSSARLGLAWHDHVPAMAPSEVEVVDEGASQDDAHDHPMAPWLDMA